MRTRTASFPASMRTEGESYAQIDVYKRQAYIYYHKLFRLSTPFFIFLCKPEFAKIRSKLLSLEANLFIILRCS